MITSEQRHELIEACDYFPTLDEIKQWANEDAEYTRQDLLINIWTCISLLNDHNLFYIVTISGLRNKYDVLPDESSRDYEKTLVEVKRELIRNTIELIHRLLATGYNKDSLKVLIEFLVWRVNVEKEEEENDGCAS